MNKFSVQLVVWDSHSFFIEGKDSNVLCIVHITFHLSYLHSHSGRENYSISNSKKQIYELEL